MKINTIQILNNSKVIISAHIFASGPALELEEFLKNKVKTLLFIGHHFSYSKNKTSFYRLYKKGKTVKKTMFKRTFVPDVVMLFVESILTFLWVIKTREKFDYFIGSDNYSSFLGLVLKRLGFE